MAGSESLSTRESTSTALRRLGKQFDQAPVRAGARVVGYALTSELAGSPGRRVGTVMHPASPAVTVEADAPIRQVLPILRDHRFAFVQEGEHLAAFIVPSDLNKQAARAYFYLLIASLEVALAQLIRANSTIEDQSDYLKYLGTDARFAVECRYFADQRMGVDVDYVTYLDFMHLLRIVGRVKKFQTAVDAISPANWEKSVGGLPQLRNDVMHSTREFLSPMRAVDDLMRHESFIRRILHRLQEPSTG
jgi:hypothetical protein